MAHEENTPTTLDTTHSKQELNLKKTKQIKIYKLSRLISTQSLWLEPNQDSRNTAFIKPAFVQSCNAGWRSNGYHALKTCLIARRSFR